MKRSIFPAAFVMVILPSLSFAQALSKHPTIQQVVGYQQFEQRQWTTRQLPKNSVMLLSDQRFAAGHSLQYEFGKGKKTPTPFVLSKYELPGTPVTQLSSSPSSLVNLPRFNYRQWQREGRLKQLMGTQNSLWLRDLILQAKGHPLLK
jgi:hypothetical protein